MASNTQTGGQQLTVAVTSGLLILTTFVVYLRLYIRCVHSKSRSAGWDDLTVFFAWIMALAASVATYFETAAGLGRHVKDLSQDELYSLRLAFFIVIQCYTVGVSMVKISFLAQFHRLFHDRLVKTICVCFAFFCFLWMIVQALLYSFTCEPIQYLVPTMSSLCVPTLGIWTAIACVNTVINAIIFCIPVKPFASMRLLSSQKYVLVALFCFGFVICLLSAVRIPTLRRGATSPDPTFTNVTHGLWSLAELETAILCTSIPVLRPMVSRCIRSPTENRPKQSRTGSGSSSEDVKRSSNGSRGPRNKPQLYSTGKSGDTALTGDTGLSGSTLKPVTRPFFGFFTSRTAARDEEQLVKAAAPEPRTVRIRYHPRSDEKSLESSDIAEVDCSEQSEAQKQQKKKYRNSPIDFFDHDSLEKGLRKNLPDIPRDGAPPKITDLAEKPPMMSPSPRFASMRIASSSAGSATPLTSVSSLSTELPLSGRRPSGDELRSYRGLNASADAVSNATLRAPSATEPERPRASLVSAASSQLPDACTCPGRENGIICPVEEYKPPRAVQATCLATQSIQTALSWESGLMTRSDVTSSAAPSPASSSAPSPAPPMTPVLEGPPKQQGTIARARERAAQAVADKTFGQVNQVQQGKARIVQMDSSQRRQAGVGLAEILGLDGLSPPGADTARRLERGSQPPRSVFAAPPRDGGPRQKRGAEESAKENRQGPRAGGVNRLGDRALPPLPPPVGGRAGDRTAMASSAAKRGTGPTSWLRLSTDNFV